MTDQINTYATRRIFMGGTAALGASLALAPSFAWAKSGPQAEVWPGVTQFTDGYVRSGKLAGAIAAMGLGQDALQFVARGQRTFEGAPMDGDSLFRIYSMTKPVTGMAVMALIDDGKLKLDQPLADILPKYTSMQVQRVPDGSITDLVPAQRPITIRHLLTHTSGLGYSIIQNGPIKTAYVQAGLVPGQISRLPIAELFGTRNTTLTLTQFADRLADMPLVYQPGTKWSYSVGLDLLGRVIEVVSGQTFDAFLQERLFDPLGMTSTWFQVPQDQVRRMTTNYGIMQGVLLPLDPGTASVFAMKPAFPFGGAGLVSSPRDYDRFLRMLLGYGKFEGKRIIGEEAVRIGTSNLLPAGISTVGTFATGGGFGAGGRVGLGVEAGTFGWAGAAGTMGFVDMKRGWRGGFYAQYMPASAYPIQGEFPQVAMKDAIAALGVNA
ncbi:putative hydrolase [Caenibius tardaugens NBRC 16725]|uniref:Putative hydrolase n=1 Tax=Caenibius tardaugens NBRC 16725 TaxID=1219035 RepID=U2ZZV9_9SPHN|nr:serine hydrolase domain-containing protein [Caenibius tardaugens]AZI34562.1 class A beta-lactamase-related serine hydrolase [Caenibius tardaugens NBRC 16725]GAD48063.1 putative hydrolase [Caenibius tardaugens NBRC 16725]